MLPSTAITRFDLSIGYSEFSLLKNQQGFRGLQLMPDLGVGAYDSDFLRINIESLLTKIEETQRAPRSGYNEDKFEWTKDSYRLEDHGVTETMDDEEIRRYGSIMRAERICSMRAMNRVWQRLEYDIKVVIEGLSNTTAAANAWNTSSGTPIDDIEAAIEAVEARTGCTPNTISMTDVTWRRTRRNDQFIALIDNGTNDRPSQLSKQGLLEYFDGIERLVITRGFQNNANEGQSASVSRIWDTTKVFVGLCSNDGMDGDLESTMPCVGRTLFANDEVPEEFVLGDTATPEPSIIIEEYRTEDVRGSKLRARNHRQVKKIHDEAGQIITSVL